ncbi:MAG: hypothetical protein L0154_12150 [Chloroflexi bacterium]|nr:hypothetical protein [Chloroflexota bacterium]
MDDFYAIATIIGMFLIRIGIPFTLLIILGTLIERHQNRQRAKILEMPVQKQSSDDQKKAA